MFMNKTYQVPEGCSYREKDDKFKCEGDGKSACFAINKLNRFWENDIEDLCFQTLNQYYLCQKDLECYK